MPDRKKRYFWLQLKEDFFDDDTMAYIEEQPNGTEYALIYLKMCLKSLKLNGYLKRVVGSTMIPYDITTMAKLVNSNVDTVRVAMKLFESIGLVKVLDSGEIYMSQIKEMIGSETEAAKQKRIERAKKEVATLSQDSRKNVTQSKSYSKSNSNSLDLEKENITTEKKAVANSQNENISAYQKVLRYYEESGYGLASPIITQKMNYELQDFVNAGSTFEQAADIICKAMEIGAMNNAKTFSYVLKITKGWLEHNLKTFEQVEAYINRPTFSNSNYGRAEKVEPKLDKQQQPEEFKMTKEEREKWIRDNI